MLNQTVFKMATQSSTSDFSIDHILNRAGDRFAGRRYEVISSGSSSGDESNSCDNNFERSGYVESERFMEIPAFDWLNYTRYNMPRLPRKLWLERFANLCDANWAKIDNRSAERPREANAGSIAKDTVHTAPT